MKAPDDSSGTDQRLFAALLDYQRHPGRYQVSRREPTLLFASIREILQLAAGRAAGKGARSRPTAQIQEAARYFACHGLFYPGADHYSLFGLPRGAPSPELKDRYRLLMRLTHPDYAGPGTWPPDTAVRVNRAYKVLSSPALRRDYDSSLPPPGAAPASPPRRRSAASHASGLLARSGLPQVSARKGMLIAGIAGVAAVILIVAAFTLGNRSEPRQLARTRAPLTDALPDLASKDAPPTSNTRPAAVAPAAPAPPAKAPSAAPRPTLVEVQPLLTLLLQELESGRGERLLGLLEPESRNLPAARALFLHYNTLVQGSREVRLSSVYYRAEPSDGGLVVTSQVRLVLNENGPKPTGLGMTVRAEFAHRNGAVVLTGLSGSAQ
jgi:hypothetical protein